MTPRKHVLKVISKMVMSGTQKGKQSDMLGRVFVEVASVDSAIRRGP